MKRSKRYAEIAKSYDKHELVDVATAVKQLRTIIMLNNTQIDFLNTFILFTSLFIQAYACHFILL